MAYKLLAIFLLLKTATAFVNLCCPSENNTIVGKRCVDGSSPLTTLSCPAKYLRTNNSDISIDDNHNLVIATARIPPDRYCASNAKDDEVFIICFSEDSENSIFTVYAALELVSVFFILITIFVYLQVRDVLDLQGVCILHSISGLALSFLTLGTNQLITQRILDGVCVGMAYVIYFTMLYSFFWLNVLAFHIWRTIVRPKFLKIDKHWPYIYHAYGCGGPIFLLIILIIAHSIRTSEMHPGFGETKCWFKSTYTQFVYFYGPLAILLFLNMIFYGWTIAVLWRRLGQNDAKKTKVLKYRLLLCVKLFFIMGISWIFELLSGAFQDVESLTPLWHVTDGLNTLQGILIFLILVVLRKRVVRGLAERSFCGLRLPARWRAVADDECEEIEEELNLSETQIHKQ